MSSASPHQVYVQQFEEGKRICKECEKVFPESYEFFYYDGNVNRTRCINCYNEEKERLVRERGVMTKKLVREKFEMGESHCGECDNWKSFYEFRNNFNDLNQLHRWCEECEMKYMREYNIRNKYGDNYEEMYYEEKKHLLDLNLYKWNSEEERDITNWLINKNIKFDRGPYYKKVFEGDYSRRRFDWIIWDSGKTYLVEYFGLWDTGAKHERIVKCVKKAKKKIKTMYQNREDFNFIIIFPVEK